MIKEKVEEQNERTVKMKKQELVHQNERTVNMNQEEKINTTCHCETCHPELYKANQKFVILNLFQNLKFLCESVCMRAKRVAVSGSYQNSDGKKMLNSGDESISRRLMLQHDKKRAAFTLAETLITLTILGVVAAITVPSLINKQIESANRTKVKKAMAVYEKALNQMIIDNDVKGSLNTVEGFRTTDTCSESTKYFKKVEETTACKFKTADRVWWDITDIENPIIAFNESDLLAATAADATTNKAFYLIGRRADGILRINDKGFEDSITSGNADNIAAMTKLYNFINKVESTSGSGTGGGTPSIFASCNNTYPCEVTYDCPTTDNPSKTCTATQSKPVTFTTSAYDDSIGDGCYSDSATCAALKAKSATGGPFMTTNIGGNIPWNNAEAECKKLGDNYRVATTAELQQMYSAGTLKCYDGSTGCSFWASEETSDGSGGVGFNAGSGEVSYGGKDVSYDGLQVLCLGNE